MESISMERELSKYNMDRKWNDYIGAQKEIISVLKGANYFECGDIVNCETGMNVRITSKGIKETIGKGKRFQNLPKEGEKFAYFISQVLIDNILHDVRIVVKKKVNTNYFYIHHIDTEKKF